MRIRSVPTLALPRSGWRVVELGSTSQPGQIPSSPCVSIIAEPPETSKSLVKGPQPNPFSLFAEYGNQPFPLSDLFATTTALRPSVPRITHARTCKFQWNVLSLHAFFGRRVFFAQSRPNTHVASLAFVATLHAGLMPCGDNASRQGILHPEARKECYGKSDALVSDWLAMEIVDTSLAFACSQPSIIRR